MRDKTEERLSWLVMLLSAAYVVWTAVAITTRIPAFSVLFDGLAAELPAFTRLVITLSQPLVVWPITACALIALLVNQVRQTSFRTRLLTSVAVFIGAALAGALVTEALFRPMLALIEQLG